MIFRELIGESGDRWERVTRRWTAPILLVKSAFELLQSLQQRTTETTAEWVPAQSAELAGDPVESSVDVTAATRSRG